MTANNPDASSSTDGESHGEDLARCVHAMQLLPSPPCSSWSSAEPPRVSSDSMLLDAACEGRCDAMTGAIMRGATALDPALRAAIAGGHASAIILILERGALATAIGTFSSALHRPGLSVDERIRAMNILLRHIAQQSPEGYRKAVAKALLAGGGLREGALLLAALVRGGHVACAFAVADGNDRLAQRCVRKAIELNKKAQHVSWSLCAANADAVVCDYVRVPIRRKFNGYVLAGQQLQLCMDGLAELPWSPAVHSLYPAPFRRAVRCVLLCAVREPLSKLPEALVHTILERLAALQFWEAPEVELEEGEEIRLRSGGDIRKAPSYKTLR